MTAHDVAREMLTEGRSRWPSIELTPEQYQRHCEVIRGARPLAELREHAADIYLCCACAQQQRVAVQILRREAEPTARGAIIRVHREGEFVRETLQELWQKLLTGPDARINDYCAKGPLQAWLRIAAARLAIDRWRAKHTLENRETDLSDQMIDQGMGPESKLTRGRFYQPFREAVRTAVAELTRKERNLLRMHIQGRCSIDQIGRAYGVHRATAARWLEQVKEHIVQAVRTRLKLAGPALTDSEFYSVARAMGGELELGLSAVPLDESTTRWSSMS